MFYYLHYLQGLFGPSDEPGFWDHFFHLFNLFRYITVRSVFALFTAFALALLMGPRFIARLRRLNVGEDTTKTDSNFLARLHEDKKDTPTMGGLLILGSLVISSLLWARLTNFFVVAGILFTILMGLIGFFDDLIKLTQKNRSGMSVREKMLWLIGAALPFAIFLFWMFSSDGVAVGMRQGEDLLRVQLPFFRDAVVDPKAPLVENLNYLGVLYIPFAVLVLCATTNAVNLTDGLDGLAIGTSTITAIALMIVTYLASHFAAAKYLNIYHIPEAGELTVFVAALIGAALGFFWFNGKPALVFMGNTGSLAIGGALGYTALVIHQELLLFLIGGIFVLEALSVIIQVGYYKMTKKRVFLCAPIHHHFQFLGWPETRIVTRFLIVAALLAILGIISLKVR